MKPVNGRTREAKNLDGLRQMQMLHLRALRDRAIAKAARQAKNTERKAGWSGSGQGGRECERRRKQLAHAAELRESRAARGG